MTDMSRIIRACRFFMETPVKVGYDRFDFFLSMQNRRFRCGDMRTARDLIIYDIIKNWAYLQIALDLINFVQ